MPARRKSSHQATVVVLVRHGTTPTTGKVLPGRAPGLHLAPRGRRQAEAVAERLATTSKLAAVYTSPVLRAKQTASFIAERVGVDLRVDKGLSECDFGSWTGAQLSALRRLPEWSTVQRWPSGFRFPDGESFHEMATRFATALGRIRDRHPGETIVAVSHADPIKAAVADALGTPLDLFQRVVIDPCSTTTIAFGPDGPMVQSVNVAPDLAVASGNGP
jgi:probable phosphomutase (TIGR03848 family)